MKTINQRAEQLRIKADKIASIRENKYVNNRPVDTSWFDYKSRWWFKTAHNHTKKEGIRTKRLKWKRLVKDFEI